MDSAFASPSHDFSQPFPTATGGYVSSDSAFGSADPTPTHTNKKPQTSQLDFNEDPFQNVNHRYGDPFELAGADPFENQTDPFTAPVTDAFGGGGEGAKATNVQQKRSIDNFGESSENDPFSLTLQNSLKDPKNDPFAFSSSSTDPFAAPASSKGQSADPFGSSFNDPFAPSAGNKPSQTQDDWFATGPFSSAPKVDGVIKSTTTKNSSKSLAVGWGSNNDQFGKSVVAKVDNADPFSSTSIPRKKPSKTIGKTDFLTGSPMKGIASPGEQKEKKKHKWVPKLPSTGKGDKMTRPFKNKGNQQAEQANAQQPKQNIDKIQLQLAAEASKKSEEDRQRRLQLQEEQDLAYAIALSKAEAASLKSN